MQNFKEELNQSNHQLEKIKTDADKKYMCETVIASSTRQTSRVRFLESKVFVLESALQSAQIMSRTYGTQAETSRQICFEREATIHRMEERESIKEDEAQKLALEVKDLEGILSICKRRIVEQNQDNAILAEQVTNNYAILYS